VSTACRRCRSSLSQPDVVGYGREVDERVKKIISVPKTKKKDELSMKLLDDPKIPTARRNPQRPHHSHKLLDIALEMGLKPGIGLIGRDATPPNFNPKNGKTEPSSRWGPRSTPLPWPEDHKIDMFLRRHRRETRKT
jgi:hypothetical protein